MPMADLEPEPENFGTDQALVYSTKIIFFICKVKVSLRCKSGSIIMTTKLTVEKLSDR